MIDEARTTWQKRLARWKASGESATTFSAREGIKPGRLYWWSAKLRREGAASTADPAPVRMMQLVRVPARAPGVGISIDVQDARARVVVEPGFDRATLATVLEVLGVRSAP
jgi:hypothetical protein